MGGIVEVIKDGEIVRMSEERAREEDLFVLRKVVESKEEPSLSSLSKKDESVKSASRLEVWRSGKIDLKKNEVVNELIDNFHWEIRRVRRSRDINRAKCAHDLGVPEEVLKRIEMGELPSDDFILISR